jgi:hypothetical protein
MQKELKGYTIRVELDTNPRSPREDDNITKMICFHKRYDLGDKHDYKHDDYNSWEEMEKAIIKAEKPAIIKPLYMYDHSGITIKTSPFSCPWDSGQIGFVLITKEQAKKEFAYKRITKKAIEQLDKNLEGEVKDYDAYVRGDIWGYIIEKDGEHVDSCWGFIGDADYCMKEAESLVEQF